MKIYTLYYADTKEYNRSIFVMPNDETAKKAMKLNLIDKTSPQSERFRDEVRLGNVELHCIAHFYQYIQDPDEDELESETQERINPIYWNRETFPEKICNLKELLDDDKGNSTEIQHDNAN